MKHELRFSVQGQGFRRDLLIETDSVDDFSRATWFRQFLGIDGAAVVDDRLERELAEAKRQLEASRRPVPPAPVMQQPVMQPQQRMQAPPSSFMDLNPDQMQTDIWNSLSPQQQAEYQRKWLGTR